MNESKPDRIKTDIVPLYGQVRRLFALAEEIDQCMYLGPLNECRNALDHLIRAYDKFDDAAIYRKQIDECIEHLIRAGFDALDHMTVSILEKTDKLLEPFSSQLIGNIAPQVYTEFKPKLKSLQAACARSKAEKYDSVVEHKHLFDTNLENLEGVLSVYNTVELYVPELSKEKKKNRKRFFIGLAASFALGILIAIVSQKILPNICPKSDSTENIEGANTLPPQNPKPIE